MEHRVKMHSTNPIEGLSGEIKRRTEVVDFFPNHQGKTFLLDRHLASNSSGFNDPKMIRIYYFYDAESEKIVVGWLPTHLQTSKS